MLPRGLFSDIRFPACLKNRMYGFLYPVCLWYLSVFHSVIAVVPPEINFRSYIQHRNRCYYSPLIAIAIDYTPL